LEFCGGPHLLLPAGAGFALLEAGAVRAKNAKNIALKNIMDASVGGVVYYLFGYALAYGSPGDGTGNPFVGGESGITFMLHDAMSKSNATNPAVGAYGLTGWAVDTGAGTEYYGFFFQYVFAATIATIVSGAVAERIQFKAYMIYSVVLTVRRAQVSPPKISRYTSRTLHAVSAPTRRSLRSLGSPRACARLPAPRSQGIIYPPVSHWIWSADGYLYKMGTIDYAGGGAVHALSGVAAFVGAAALGPRIGAFTDGKYTPPPPHNASMMALGLFVLWFGFIPFNAGSGVSVIGWMAGQTGRIATMTTLGGCSGGCVGLLYNYIVTKHASMEHAISGVLAGMVSVCSPCAVVGIWAVFWVISPIGVLSYFFFMWVNTKCKVDDPLGASALHFGPGAVGMIAVGFFGKPDLVTTYYGCGYGEWRVGAAG
jgi:Amt family ammonium transporter